MITTATTTTKKICTELVFHFDICASELDFYVEHDCGKFFYEIETDLPAGAKKNLLIQASNIVRISERKYID